MSGASFASPRIGRMLLLGVSIAVAGCQSTRYTGVEPSARSFYEDPEFHQTYIGFDLNFTLDEPSPRPRSAESLKPLP